jgi:hypothetical protein
MSFFRDVKAKMPLDALVKEGDEWVPLADIKHELITTAQDKGKDYAVFEGGFGIRPTLSYLMAHPYIGVTHLVQPSTDVTLHTC